jgi:hypothetical protein
MIWALVNSWVYSTPVAQVDFTGLAGYTDVRVLIRGMTVSVSGQRAVRVSTDNGSTFLSASTDYLFVGSDGVETASTTLNVHATASAAARSAAVEICGFNLTSLKVAQILNRIDIRAVIIPTTSALNAVRVLNSAGGNLTAGNIYVFAR